MTVAETSEQGTSSSSNDDDAVHVDQAAKALGVSRRTIERMIDRGQL